MEYDPDVVSFLDDVASLRGIGGLFVSYCVSNRPRMVGIPAVALPLVKRAEAAFIAVVLHHTGICGTLSRALNMTRCNRTFCSRVCD